MSEIGWLSRAAVHSSSSVTVFEGRADPLFAEALGSHRGRTRPDLCTKVAPASRQRALCRVPRRSKPGANGPDRIPELPKIG